MIPFVSSVLMVPGKGLEPSRLSALAPKASVSTNFTTRAKLNYLKIYFLNFQIVVLRFVLLSSPGITPLRNTSLAGRSPGQSKVTFWDLAFITI